MPFAGFDDLYEKILALLVEDQHLCIEFETGVLGEKYDKIMTSFVVFQYHLQDVAKYIAYCICKSTKE